MLTATFGCPAGDDGETDAATTEHATEHATENGSSTDGGEESTTAGGGEESTTAGGGEESTTAADGDSTTTSSEGESSSGGVSEECQTFCMRYFGTCGENAGNDYGDQGGCEEACSGFSESGFACRIEHLQYAIDGQPDPHCGHASNGGGGVCSD